MRYFTQDQLVELANQLEESDACLESVPHYEEIIEVQEDSIQELKDSNEVLFFEISQFVAEVQELQPRSFLFCQSSYCVFTVGIVAGAGIVIAGSVLGD